jgi:hypothetical protein
MSGAQASAKSGARCEKLRPVVLEREYEHAVEIDMFEAHGRDVVLNRRIDIAAGSL